MQSFDTKDSNTLESFDRKFESFDTKDSEVKQPANNFVESSDRKVGSFDTFDTKDSELDPSDNDFVETFDRNVEINDEKPLPDSESFGTFSTKDSNDSIPNFDKFNTNSNANEQSSKLSNCVSLTSQGSEKSKTDGRRKPRSQKQIEAYKRNFNARKPLELRVDELDLRLRHLQSLVLSLMRR